MGLDRGETLTTLSKEVARALLVIRAHLSSDGRFESFMRKLGWGIESIPPQLQAIKASSDSLQEAIDLVINSPAPDAAAIDALISAITEFVQSIDDLSEVQFDPALDADLIGQVLPRQLIDGAIIEYLEDRFPLLAYLLQFLGVIRVRRVAVEGNRLPYIHEEIVWSDITLLITNPAQMFRNSHSWGGPEFDGSYMLQVLQDLAFALGLSAFLRALPNEQAQALEEGEEPTGAPFRLHLDAPIFDRRIEGRTVEAGIRFLPLPQVGTRAPGLAIMPYAATDFQRRFELNAQTHLTVASSLDLQSGIGLILRPDEAIAVVVGLNDPDHVLRAQGTVTARIEFDDPNAKPFTVIGSASGSRIELASASGQVGLLLDEQSQPELLLEIELQGARLVIAPGEGDGFLRQILPSGIASGFDLVIGLSPRRGFFFRGSSVLEVIVPTHVSVGSIEVESAVVAIRPTADQLPINVGATLVARLGPITTKIVDIGLRANFAFPGTGGNLGVLDVDISFKSPVGLGLSVDGGGFKGGGFLRFELDHERYAGILELEYQDRIELKAIGLLTTRLPGGEPGFSLLIIISTSEFIPINLGLGFTLNGVGGLLGLNRTARVERLRTGLRDNTLRSILFPENIIANADRILSDLRQVFPPQKGRFLFGPMARIGWGSPTFLTVDLGLLIEVPQPVRVFILGVARALLPDQEAKLLQLRVNFLGEIDFERELFAFDASLFDSKLLTYPLSGDMAVRMKWGDSDPNFLLTVGGFHPAYDPPPLGLPVLRRLTVQLLSGNNPRLTLETYFALTSNTAQFGARLELYAGAGKFNVYGFLSFDALFQFNPFYFIAEVGAMLALRVGSKSIASIQLALTLEGTTPWKARGTATLKLCWFIKIKVRFNKTFGEERDTRLDDVAVLPLLRMALSDKSNWAVGIPSGRHLLVSVKEIEGLRDQVVAHPFGILEISQRVVPLNAEIQTFGNQRPADGNRFAIEQVRVGEPGDTETLDTLSVQEQFAPAQFFEMSDAEKLSSKSFERYDAGVRVTASERLQAAYAAKRDVDYELFYIDSQRDQRLRHWFERLSPESVAFNAWASRGAVAASPLSFANTAKSALAPEAVKVSQEPFAVVNTSDLTPVRDDAVAFSEVGAFGLMRELIRSNPALEGEIQVVPAFEVNRS